MRVIYIEIDRKNKNPHRRLRRFFVSDLHCSIVLIQCSTKRHVLENGNHCICPSFDAERICYIYIIVIYSR